jgi:hypothetical protein
MTPEAIQERARWAAEAVGAALYIGIREPGAESHENARQSLEPTCRQVWSPRRKRNELVRSQTIVDLDQEAGRGQPARLEEPESALERNSPPRRLCPFCELSLLDNPKKCFLLFHWFPCPKSDR